MRAVMPYGAIISSVGGWKVPARRSWVSAGSLSSTMTGMPCRPSASAHIRPVGPAPATTTGRSAIASWSLFDELDPGQLLEIAVIDLLELVLRQVEPVDDAQRLADVAGAFFRIERAVGREHDLLGRIEGDAQHGAAVGAEHRRVDVEALLEVVDRALLLEAALERLVVLVRGARADLVPAGADAALEHRHDPAEMMHDQLETRIVVDRLGEDEARHRGRGLVRPAERPPDSVQRLLLVEIVGEVRAARRMDPDRLAELRHGGEELCVFGPVERLAVDVGVGLHAERAVLDRALRLAHRALRMAERHLRDPAREMILVLGADVDEPVIDQLAQLFGLRALHDVLDRRHRVGE